MEPNKEKRLGRIGVLVFTALFWAGLTDLFYRLGFFKAVKEFLYSIVAWFGQL